MKHFVWVLTTLSTMACTGLVLANSCWFQDGPAPTPSGKSAAHAKADDSLAPDAVWRWRQCQPTHWRACVLQHH
jgi:hypothetical protein